MEICNDEPRPKITVPTVLKIKNKLKVGHGECCNCCCCKLPQFPVLKYIQPERPKNFAPRRCYQKSDWPMEDGTTYKLSYWKNCADRVKPIIPEGSLTVSDCPFATDTTQKMSYMGNYCIKPRDKILPCIRDWFGRGPMQDCTTVKHDFNWKYCNQRKKIKHPGQICCPRAPLSEDTTYKLSYYESNCHEKPVNYKPVKVYQPSDVPLQDCTTYKLSYFNTELNDKEHYPWMDKLKYQAPTNKVDGCTTYKLSYWPQCEERVKPIVHPDDPNLLNKDCPTEEETTYQLSYFGGCGERPKPIYQKGNLTVDDCPLSHDTVQKLSYPGNWCPKKPEPIIPCKKSLLGRGPMEDCTTTKCDYFWKCPIPNPVPRPAENLGFSPAPLSTCTTNRLSYMPNDLEVLTPQKSYAPHREYLKSDVPMQSCTVNILSYQPQESEPIDKPWAKKPDYVKPTNSIDDNTTYKLSYFPPGVLVPCCPPVATCPTTNNTCAEDCHNSCEPEITPCPVACS